MCVSEYRSVLMCVVTSKARRRYYIPWQWSYRQLRATLREYWELNFSPLQEQQAPLTAEPSLLLPVFPFPGLPVVFHVIQCYKIFFAWATYWAIQRKYLKKQKRKKGRKKEKHSLKKLNISKVSLVYHYSRGM